MPISYIYTGEPMTGTPNDDFVIAYKGSTGTDNNTVNGNGGDDLVIGDSSDTWIPSASYLNGSIATAFNLETLTSTWTTAENEMFGDWTIPHMTAMVETTIGQSEYFRVQVGAGQQIRIDIDFGSSTDVGIPRDMVVELQDSLGNVIATADDSLVTDGGQGSFPSAAGSASSYDPYLTFTAPTAGIYYINVRPFGSGPGSTFTENNTFLMNVSVTGHAVNATNPVQGNDVINGGDGNDALFGQGGGDVINGDAGNDFIDAGSGGDIVHGGEGNDTLYGGDGTEENIHGDNGNDTLYSGGEGHYYGDAGNDIIYAGLTAGVNEVLDGGAGIDTLDTTTWNGTYVVDLITGATNFGEIFTNFENVVTGNGSDMITGTSGANIVSTKGGDDTVDAAEGNDIVTGDIGNDTLNGGSGDDTLYGGDGDDAIDGGAGNDLMQGGAGKDTASYASAAAKVTVSLAVGAAQNSGGAGTDTLSGFENLTGSAFNDTLTGDSGANVIDGGDGNDLIVGGLGDDTLYGGLGINTVSYAAATSAVTIDLNLPGSPQNTGGAGNDTLSLFQNVIGTNYNDVLSGDANANTLTGGSGNDTLKGGAGNDKLDGGAGIDTASYAGTASGVTVNLLNHSVQNTVGAGSDQLVSIENVVGSAFDDTLTGNEFANVLTGSDGNDLLLGSLGNDFLYGGLGIDTASYAAATGNVRVNLTLAGVQSTISAGSDMLSGIENLTGGAYDDQLTGDGGANILTGNAGNDLLIGGLGDDTLSGGAGSDTASYANATAGVTISLLLTAPQNTGGAGIDTFSSIENVTGSAYGDTLTGSAQINSISGGNGNDTIDAGSSNDTVDGGYGNDIIKGAAGDDVLIGGVGSDTITGGAGADTLTGGTQADTFIYMALGDSAPATADRITDFASGDILDVSAIDADTTVGGNQAFHFAAAFTHTAGEYRLAFNSGTNTTTALFDTNGDAAADMTILFTGNVTALTGDWVL